MLLCTAFNGNLWVRYDMIGHGANLYPSFESSKRRKIHLQELSHKYDKFKI